MLLLSFISGAMAWTSIERDFQDAITKVESMVWDSSVQAMAARHGLSAVNVTWEDTGRSKGSSWGPNISDMTIGVRDPSGALHPMPVLRFDNYTDITGDISPEKLWMRVGNEDGRSLYTVSLSDLLQNPRNYLHNPASFGGRAQSLWDSRDSHVIVSAQACFLPIPKQGSATFTPVLYNYQSYPGNPAVLTMTATREGTSMQVIENDGGYLSEVLSFNDNGMRAPYTAMRLSDFQAQGGDATSSGNSNDPGLSVVMIVQVPLKQKAPPPTYYGGWGYEMEDAPSMAAPMAESAKAGASDVEVAVVGHGPVEGPFSELNGLSIERDPQFPVRVTVQFYKATSNGVVTDSDVRAIRSQLDKVLAQADYVGSLVTDGYTGRPTEWVQQPPNVSENANWASGYWNWLVN